MTPYLAHIVVFPVKSLGPVERAESALVSTGALEHDREFGFFDVYGKFINGKRSPLIHGLASDIDLATGELCFSLKETGEKVSCQWPDDTEIANRWLSDYFGQSVYLRRNDDGGFPDDNNALGPTVISTATLEEVASWFPGLSVESARIRFRANLEIGGVPPFWEDRLFGMAETVTPFTIGEVTFYGTNPCQRCVVPPRDPESGEAIAEFSQIFRSKREETLPDWAERSRFNHFYRLAINTRALESERGKVVKVGDPVRLV